MDEPYLDLSYVEEKSVFCDYCADLQWINALLPYPCPECNLDKYREWEEYDKERETEELRQKLGVVEL